VDITVVLKCLWAC